MSKKEMDEQIKEEMKHISQDIRNTPQRILRCIYNTRRRNDTHSPKEHILKLSVDRVKEQHPDFNPKYDKKFFKI
ncbi:MAG: hypothetical protein KAT05_03685 [Spirochaetes bacterium]|nr:hypothetical protein [Spirochaetota bacterium]